MSVDPRHPLFDPPRPTFWVPPMKGLASAINAGIEFNRHGIIVPGLGRIGKTEAIEMLARTSDWRDFRIIFEIVRPGDSRLPTEAYFFTQLALSQGLKIREQSIPTFVIDQVANHLCEKASRAGAKIIVMAIDDANRLRHDDYKHLVTLDNRISARGYRLFVVLIVQEDADQSSIPVSNPTPHPSQITGRFTGDRYPYTGLRDAVEIEAAFKNFVDQRWNDRSYLEEFAPTLHRNGWQSADLAVPFWDQAQQLRGEHHLDPVEPFPMQSFDPASYYLFGRVAAEDPKLERFTPEHLRKALELSGLIELELSRKPTDVR